MTNKLALKAKKPVVIEEENSDSDWENVEDAVPSSSKKRGRPQNATKSFVRPSDRINKYGEVLLNCNVDGCMHEYSFPLNKRADRIRQHLINHHEIVIPKALIKSSKKNDADNGKDAVEIASPKNLKRGRPLGKTKEYVYVSDRVNIKNQQLVNCAVEGCSHEYTFPINQRGDRVRLHLSSVHSIEIEASHKAPSFYPPNTSTQTILDNAVRNDKRAKRDEEREAGDVERNVVVKRRPGRPEGVTKAYVTISSRTNVKGQYLLDCAVEGCFHQYSFPPNERAERIRKHLLLAHSLILPDKKNDRKDDSDESSV